MYACPICHTSSLTGLNLPKYSYLCEGCADGKSKQKCRTCGINARANATCDVCHVNLRESCLNCCVDEIE